MKKEERAYISREDTTENFIADDSSSDENMDYNVAVGGITLSLCCFPYFVLCLDISYVHGRYVIFKFMAPLDKVDCFLEAELMILVLKLVCLFVFMICGLWRILLLLES